VSGISEVREGRHGFYEEPQRENKGEKGKRSERGESGKRAKRGKNGELNQRLGTERSKRARG
jgi:hypothetical protein